MATKEELQDFLGRVKMMDGVTGAVVASVDGGLLAKDLPSETNIDEFNAITVFSAGLAMQIDAYLSLGKLENVLIEGRDYKIIVVSKDTLLIGVLTEAYVSVKMIESEIRAMPLGG